MNTSDLIRAARKQSGLSQQELANRLGVSQAMIGQYERGIRNPKYGTLIRIAEILRINVKELMPEIVFSGELSGNGNHGTFIIQTLDEQVKTNIRMKKAFEEMYAKFHVFFDESLSNKGKMKVIEYARDLSASREYRMPDVEPLDCEDSE